MRLTALRPAIVVLSLACGRESPPPSISVAEWRLSASPAIIIGVDVGDPSQELSQATSSLRLSDGRIIVANSGSQELRVFDSAGQVLTTIGRKGEGPGEFAGSLQIRAIGPDRFTVYDVNLQKLATFDTAGHFIGEERVQADGLNDFPLSTWLFRANWVDGPVDTLRRGEIAAVLDRLPDPPPGGFRFVKVADDGKLWMQVRAGTDRVLPWEILSSEGNLIASIVIPEDLEVHQVGPDFLTVRHWGSNDVEHVQLYRIEATNARRDHPAPELSGDRSFVDSSQVEQELAREVRNLVTVQEMHYADHAGYATRARDLRNWQAPPGMQVHLMAADRRGWVGLFASRTAPMICGMAVGGSTPPGWREGSPKCSGGLGRSEK